MTIPFMFDQIRQQFEFRNKFFFLFLNFRNSLAVGQGGWGVGLTKETLRDDPKMLQTALNEVLNNDKLVFLSY